MMVTQKMIADRLGVSRELVAHALRDRPGVARETRQRIRDTASAMGYRPNPIARQLRGQHSHVIGVLIGNDNPQVNFDRLARLEQEAFQHGYRLMVGHIHDAADRVEEYLHDFAARRVDAVFWLDQPANPRPLVSSRAARKVPNLISLHDPSIAAAAAVQVDYADGIRQAVRHLVARGRQRIGLVLAAPGWEGNPLAERRRGYHEELTAQQRPVEAALEWIGHDLLANPREHAVAIVQALVEQQHADALLASNDLWAIELIRALRQRGHRVPGDVAVIGFDNLNLASLFDPPLTTIDQRHAVFAQAAMGLLVELVEHGMIPAASRRIVIAPELIVRETT